MGKREESVCARYTEIKIQRAKTSGKGKCVQRGIRTGKLRETTRRDEWERERDASRDALSKIVLPLINVRVG